MGTGKWLIAPAEPEEQACCLWWMVSYGVIIEYG